MSSCRREIIWQFLSSCRRGITWKSLSSCQREITWPYLTWQPRTPCQIETWSDWSDLTWPNWIKCLIYEAKQYTEKPFVQISTRHDLAFVSSSYTTSRWGDAYWKKISSIRITQASSPTSSQISGRFKHLRSSSSSSKVCLASKKTSS